jgi:ketosteroid isomerase-like protein
VIAPPVPQEVLDRLRVQERFDCWNRGELDLMMEPYAPDAVFDVSAVFPDVEPMRGEREMRRYWMELQETWGGGLRLDPLELLDVGDGRLVLDLRLWGTGTHSGIEVDQRLACLYEVGPDGKFVHMQLLPDVETALAAARSAAEAT